MGQYYTVANMDKREVLCIEGKFIGGTLLEIAETASDSLAILNQIAGPWHTGINVSFGSSASSCVPALYTTSPVSFVAKPLKT